MHLFILSYSGQDLFSISSSHLVAITYLFHISLYLEEKDSVKEKKLATKLFGYSILYLFLIFTSILIDKLV